MIYKFTEFLNDLVNYFILGDILLLKDWKNKNNLPDDLATEFTTNENGDNVVLEGIILPMTGIENYPYTIIFNVSDDVPELLKEGNRLQFTQAGYSLKIENNTLILFTWRILEQFTNDNINKLLNYYKRHNRPMIELANGWYTIEILGGETLQDSYYEPTFEFVIKRTESHESTEVDLSFNFAIESSVY